MFLLFLLDVVERLAQALVGEFEDAGVVEMGGVLLTGQKVVAEESVVQI